MKVRSESWKKVLAGDTIIGKVLVFMRFFRVWLNNRSWMIVLMCIYTELNKIHYPNSVRACTSLPPQSVLGNDKGYSFMNCQRPDGQCPQLRGQVSPVLRAGVGPKDKRWGRKAPIQLPPAWLRWLAYWNCHRRWGRQSNAILPLRVDALARRISVQTCDGEEA